MTYNYSHRFSMLFFLVLFFSAFSITYSEEPRDTRVRLPVSILCHNCSQNTKNRIFFFTQQRSGSYWMLYILKYFTRRPLTIGNDYANDYEQLVNYHLPFIHFLHMGIRLKLCPERYPFHPPTEQDKALVIIRNPIDSVLRNSISADHALAILNNPTDGINPQEGAFTLFANLRYFDTWPEKNRYFLYYEDLLDHPKEEIEKLLQFLNVRCATQLDDFIANLDAHTAYTLAFYNQHQESKTMGIDRTYHQRQCTETQLQALQDKLVEMDPVIWEKYLKRYEL